MASLSPKRVSSTITKSVLMFVGGYILFNLWKKRNKNILNVVIKSLPVDLVKSCPISSSYHRNTNSKYTPSHLIGKSAASYVDIDGYPFLIVSQSSLNEVNRRLIKKGFNEIQMNRFRASIVIRTQRIDTPINYAVKT